MLTPARQEKLRRVAAQRQQGVLVLEDVQERSNLHACTRSYEACGFQRVCVIFERIDPYSVRRGGLSRNKQGATRWLDYESWTSTEECLSSLRAEGYELVATALGEGAEELYTARLDRPKLALLLGNEGEGLSPTALAMADRAVMIPMRGMVQSYNIAACAAICLYEITRQRMELGMQNYLFSPEEQAALAERLSERRNTRQKVW